MTDYTRVSLEIAETAIANLKAALYLKGLADGHKYRIRRFYLGPRPATRWYKPGTTLKCNAKAVKIAIYRKNPWGYDLVHYV